MSALSGTTGLLLLGVFAVVNVACLVLEQRADKTFFRAPVWVPVAGAALCLFLVGPWARTESQMIQYEIAGAMLLLGVALWAVTYVVDKASGQGAPRVDAVELDDH